MLPKWSWYFLAWMGIRNLESWAACFLNSNTKRVASKRHWSRRWPQHKPRCFSAPYRSENVHRAQRSSSNLNRHEPAKAKRQFRINDHLRYPHERWLVPPTSVIGVINETKPDWRNGGTPRQREAEQAGRQRSCNDPFPLTVHDA